MAVPVGIGTVVACYCVPAHTLVLEGATIFSRFFFYGLLPFFMKGELAVNREYVGGQRASK